MFMYKVSDLSQSDGLKTLREMTFDVSHSAPVHFAKKQMVFDVRYNGFSFFDFGFNNTVKIITLFIKRNLKFFY